MKTVAIVPMKMNNSRLPNKNVKAFDNGEPLCTYVLNTLLKVKGLDEIYVYCSEESVKEYLPEGVKYLTRSEELNRDTTTINDVIGKFAETVKADTYLLTFATAPFIKAESIEKAIKAVNEEGYDSALAVERIQDFMWKDGKPFNYDIRNTPRTQDLEPYYLETSGFYAYTKEVVADAGRRIGDHPKLIEIDEIESVDIDEKKDFDLANLLYNAMRSLER
ncbi:MAG: cytidylyltransferase domain-containing protein [Lachnospiraceae bacterium]